MLLACFPLSLHFTMVEGPISVPPRQQRLGIPEVRSISNDCTGREANGEGQTKKQGDMMRLQGDSRHNISKMNFELHAILDSIPHRRALISRHVPPVLNADPAGSHLTGFLL